ncbi:Major Facilitator Superfamily protein [Lacunisphaera limnophila]|uniref:Major Facilitator Superfamily protein n=1 Tax=Lacunisphaera limnophila TaxID=1838286 RepID=A0A1D8AX54_9BACT|nr:MFS transporter [Lacunisphaera limnophila]AOS45447.1 Major Facilitator Superfamily protein [Lacunisphaera limnophila]
MNPSRLFTASCAALITTAMSFAIRGGATGDWIAQFNLTNEQAGWVNGTAFWGFTLAMMFGGPLVDTLGFKKILGIAFVGHLAGILLTIFAWDFWSLFAGTLLFGIANGSVEAACNPLVATLYPKDQTTKLNHFHVWFPGGIVIGGLLAFVFAKMGLGWQAQFATMLIPLAAYGFMFMGQALPQTQRVQRGESTGSMFAACVAPGFILMVACMLLTAATELGSGQWIPNILSHAGVSGILVLVWINGIMAVGRMFAGPFVHKLSPIGMLVMSAILSTLGLYAMSHSTGNMLFAAATVFAFGVCFFWPTMVGYVAENYPKTGALGMAIIGGAGMLSVSFVLPIIGRWYDAGIAARMPVGEAPTGDALATIQSAAGLQALGQVAVLPVVLTVVFILIAVMKKKPAAAAH